MAESGTVIQLPHLSSHVVHAALFKDVKNSAFLRQQLINANADFEYAFFDASVILSINHVLAGVFRAINDLVNGRLKSRNVHSEIVFSLSPNNNIAESFRRFGITDQTTNLLAIKVIALSDSLNSHTAAVNSVSSHVGTSVEGTPVAFTDGNIAEMSDLSKIRKIYKLPLDSKPHPGVQLNGSKPNEDEFRQMEGVILGTMAVKGS